MKRLKKLAAVALTGAMALSMAACGSDSTSTTAGSGATDSTGAETTQATEATTGGSETSKTPRHEGDTPRTIKIGTWYDIYYDSNQTDVFDDPSYVEPAEDASEDTKLDAKLAQMRLDNVRRVEEKYNVRIEYVNLTFEGITESINTSVLAGKPDCDIYMVNANLALPALASGYAAKLEDVLPADADVLTSQNYLQGVKLNGFDGTYLMLPVLGQSIPEATYPLAFNKQMLEDAGLENPNDLYARGEWTWDKWREYLLKLTQDKDGDGVTDVYGFGSSTDSMLSGFLFSNGTTWVNGTKENISSKEVGEALDFIYNMYNVDHTARPWNEEDWEDNRLAFKTGQVACWATAQWIAGGYIDGETGESSLGFEEIWCPWPVGPSGNKETNFRKNLGNTNFYILPTGVDDPYLVYSVLQDYTDFYGDVVDGKNEYRDHVGKWWHVMADGKAYIENGTTTNYDITYYLGQASTIDLWDGLGVDYQFPSFYKGEMTAAQFQETNKQLLQTALDSIFK